MVIFHSFPRPVFSSLANKANLGAVEKRVETLALTQPFLEK